MNTQIYFLRRTTRHSARGYTHLAQSHNCYRFTKGPSSHIIADSLWIRFKKRRTDRIRAPSRQSRAIPAMRPKDLPWTSLLLTFVLFTQALAQNNNNNNNAPLTNSPSSASRTAAPTASPSTPSSARTPSVVSTSIISSTPTKKDASTTSNIASTTLDTASSPSLPGLTTSSSSDSDDLGGLLTGLPKLPGDDYPPPTVPPTANAPFMQRKSTLPEGTVFIAVGAVLGLMALVVITWRGLVAWSLHRSVRRAALIQSAKYNNGGGRGIKVTRNSHRNSKARYYKSGPGSTLSLEHLGASGRGGRKSANVARESLFFSPTASPGMQNQGNRGSGYLPAGYYAAGASAPGAGPGMSHLNENRSSFSNLVQPGHGYSRTRSVGPSPPGSPSLPPSRGGEIGARRPSVAGGGLTMQASNSSLNLSVAPHSRAPSAYLDDLFESHQPAAAPGAGTGAGAARNQI